MSDTETQPAAIAASKRKYHRRTETPRTARKQSAPQPQPGIVGVGVMGAATGDRAEPFREEVDLEPVVRVSRADRSTNRFDIPQAWRKPGWDYQWWTVSVLGLQVDGSSILEAHDGGWRPVLGNTMPKLMTPGADPNAPIERYGQRLFTRPMRLTQEARQEEYGAAQEQQRDRMRAAAEGHTEGGDGVAGVRGVRAVPLEIQIEGEAGVYR
jgi:hypothetical protein